MNNRRGFSWVNIWLIIFGAVALYVLIGHYLDPLNRTAEGRYPAEFLISCVVSAFILLLGLKPFFVMLLGLANGRTLKLSEVEGAGRIGDIYLNSWKRLWGNRWLFLLFIGIGLISGLASLVENILAKRYLIDSIRDDNIFGKALENGSSLSSELLLLPYSIPNILQTTKGYLTPDVFPGSSHLGGAVFSGLTILLVIFGYKRLRILRQEPEMEQETGFLMPFLIPVGIVAFVQTVMMPIIWKSTMSSLMDSPQTYPTNAIPLFYLLGIGNLFINIVLVSLVIGGVLGSLKRIGSETVSYETILRDAVKHFKPLFFLNLLFELADGIIKIPNTVCMLRLSSLPSALPEWFSIYARSTSILTFTACLLLVFAPFAIVGQGDRVIRSLKSSLFIWRKNAFDILTFLAFAVSVIAVILAVEFVIGNLPPQLSTADFALTPFISVLHVLINAFMFVAVWELYRAVTREQIDVEE